MGADGNPWTWVLGENDEDASEDEKERSKLKGGAWKLCSCFNCTAQKSK